jgi:hypothetical protein
MCNVDEGAGGFDYGEPQGAGSGEVPLGRAVGRDHQGGCLHMADVLRDRDAFRLEGAQHGGVVDEVTENREWTGVGVLECERDRITNAEAHAEVGRSKDTHASWLRFMSP